MKLIILDRDGVINHDSDNFIKSVDEWIPLPGSLEAIAQLNQLGFTVAVATNQSGIARGHYSIETLNLMHEKLKSLLKPLNGHVDFIAYCPHGPDEGCDCRKPKAGMYKDIAEHFSTTLEGIYVVGDSYRDLQAALSVNAKPALVKTGKGLRTLQTNQKEIEQYAIPVFDDLHAFVQKLLDENVRKIQ